MGIHLVKCMWVNGHSPVHPPSVMAECVWVNGHSPVQPPPVMVKCVWVNGHSPVQPPPVMVECVWVSKHCGVSMSCPCHVHHSIVRWYLVAVNDHILKPVSHTDHYMHHSIICRYRYLAY